MTSERARADYDVVLLGATGFTGRLTAASSRRRGRPACGGQWPGGTGAGWRRSLPTLPVRQAQTSESSPPISPTPQSLRGLAEQTAVVATTVGPFMELGAEVVAACAATRHRLRRHHR